MNTNNSLSKILTVDDIRQHLGISKTTAYKLIKLKDFPKIIIGNRFYIPEDRYREWINGRIESKTNTIII